MTENMTENNKVYAIGHRNPDTDSICSSIAYAEYKHKKGETNILSARIGEINPETNYVLKYFGVEAPELITDGTGKRFILLDHNEKSQTIENIDKGSILGIVDHHKMNFSYPTPIYVHIEPIGSTATIVSQKYLNSQQQMTSKIAGILLSAILSDTVVFKSKTTTNKDIRIAERLANIAEIEDMKDFGIEMKKVAADIKKVPVVDIVDRDFKDFDFNGNKVGIGQVEVVDLEDSLSRKEDILKELKKREKKKGYAIVLLMVTDIMKEGTELLIAGDTDAIEKVFGKTKEGSIYLDGVMSRKSQLVPPLEKFYTK